jgi:hypothetical protein
MLNFFVKRSKVIVDCFTNNLNAFDYFPIKESASFYPDWWKNIAKTYPVQEPSGITIEKATIKSCDGFIALYQQGFMLPLWSDLVIETQENGFKYSFADEISEVGSHDYNQMSTEFTPYIHFKIISPWAIRETKGVKFMFMQPSYNHVKTLTDWHIMPGVIDFKYQHATNINFLVQRRRRYQIAAGHPIAHLIPLTDKEIELKLHVVDPTNVDHKRVANNFYPYFKGSYKKLKKIVDEKNTFKCPFLKNK